MPQEEINSEEIQEIISVVPSWIVRWGITVILSIMAGVILMSSIIHYPDIVRTSLKVNSMNPPKAILAKQNGKLAQILVEDGQTVYKHQPLAYLETIADPKDVSELTSGLKTLQQSFIKNELKKLTGLPTNLNLGELQNAYQLFYQEFIDYQSTQKNGYYQRQVSFVEKDLKGILTLREQILKRKNIQQKEYSNMENEFKAYQHLYEKKVISRSEFSQQENKYLSSKYPIQESETSLLNNTNSYTARERELMELKNKINEQQAKFLQALNKCIAECDAWNQLYVLKASDSGKVSFAGIVQQNQNVTTGQELFIVNPGNTKFYGVVQIPQYNMGKIHVGESALIKLRGYPFEQYGVIKGRLSYISDAAYRDSVFTAKINFESFEDKDPDFKIVLKNGMLADAEIITEESTLLRRFFRNIIKMMDAK